MKLGVVGKGGVGKTTVAAQLSRAFARRGDRVIAIDTDSNPNLGLSLGLSMDAMEQVPVLPRSVIVGAGGSTSAAALIAEYGRPTPAGVTLLSAIRVSEAGAGCTCAGHATVRSFLGDALADQADVTVVDMEAGLEHLSRSGGTLAYADALLVVMEPSRKSLLTAVRTKALAEELGIPHVFGLGNKAHPPDDGAFFREAAAAEGLELAGVLAHDRRVMAADRTGTAVDGGAELDGVIAVLEGAVGNGNGSG